MPDDLPAPLTPPDCDLRDFPFMPLDVLRLRDSDVAAIKDAEAFRAAVLSWCAAWHQVPAGSLPNDDDTLARLMGYGRDLKTFRKVKEGALRGYVLCSDGRLYHRVVAEKANEAWSHKERQRDRGRKGNEVRWGSRKDRQGITEGSPDASPEDRKGEDRTGEDRKEEEPLTPSASDGGLGQSSIVGRKGLRANGTNPRALAAAAEAAKPPTPEPDHPLWPLMKARRVPASEFRAWFGRCQADANARTLIAPSAFVLDQIQRDHGHVLDEAGWRMEAAQ